MKNECLKSSITKETSFFMAVPAVLWQVLFLYVPLFFIFGISFIKSFDYFSIKQLTFDNYKMLMGISYFRVILRSLFLAFFNAVFCLFVSYPIAYFLALKVRRFKNLLLFFLVLPFWTNFLVQVYAWFFILDRHGFLNSVLLKIGLISSPLHILNTPAAIYIVMLFCYLPFMVMPIYTSLSKIDKFILEASHDLGANQWQTLSYVTFPLSLSGVKTGFFLSFIPAFGEFVIPSLLGGGKLMFVGSLISYFFLETRNVFLGSAFTMFSGLVLVVSIFIIYWLFTKLFE